MNNIFLHGIPSFLYVFVLILVIFKLLKPAAQSTVQLIAFYFAMGMTIHEAIKYFSSSDFSLYSIAGTIIGYLAAVVAIRILTKRQNNPVTIVKFSE